MSYVYFVRVDKYVKIGFSYQPEKRVKGLFRGNLIIVPDDLDRAQPVELIKTIGECTAKDEARLHAAFAAHRAAGEWFRASDGFMRQLDSLDYTTIAAERRMLRKRRAEAKRAAQQARAA